jgi:NADPH:quinone reductase-like Zn-dependent oxidoreductase
VDRTGVRRGIPRGSGAAAPKSRADLMKAKRILKRGAGAIFLALIVAALVAYWTSSNDCERVTAARGDLMKAIVYCDYGSPDVLRLEAIAKPVPKDDEVLIRVRAASVNPLDWHFMRGTPYIGRVMGMGLRKPKDVRLGVDAAGRVEAVGRNVTRFKPGDEVFGAAHGAFAEYACASEKRVVVKPPNLTFEQAASIPIAGVTALQGLRDRGKVQPGQRVLINGASGGVGTFAVQIARSMGADVTGVCSTRNVAMVRSLGADRVIDYTKEDFTRAGERYDVILDNVGNHPLSACRRALTPKGRYVMVSGPKGRWVAPLDRALAAKVYSWFVRQDVGMFMARMDKDDLGILGDLVQSGKLTPAIDRTYMLSEASEAIRYLETGHARAKVIIVVNESK